MEVLAKWLEDNDDKHTRCLSLCHKSVVQITYEDRWLTCSCIHVMCCDNMKYDHPIFQTASLAQYYSQLCAYQ